jgi:Flp pilus assembly protein protease CpaA
VLALVAVMLAGAAAYTDARTGRVPSVLTLPVLLLALVVAPSTALAAMVVCGVVPFFLAMNDRMGGGDFKLFLAVGACLGMVSGLLVEYLVLALISAMPPRIRRPAAPAIFAGVLAVVVLRVAIR